VVFIVDTHKERVAVREARAKGVKVVGITDSNANPDLVDFPVPANDDAIRSIKLITELAGQAVEAGLKAKK
jgi:small subunit ribosomal protein S2